MAAKQAIHATLVPFARRLMQTGLAWLEQLAAVSTASKDGRADGLRFVQRDPLTGEDYVRIPVPSPEVLDGALRTIAGLLDRFRR